MHFLGSGVQLFILELVVSGRWFGRNLNVFKSF